MKSLFQNTLGKPGAAIALAVAGMLSSGAAQAVAIGTSSGTDITNIATLEYSVGTTPQSSIKSSPAGSTNGTGADTTFKVDTKVNLTVGTIDTTPVSVVPGLTLSTGISPPTASQVARFLVTNSGNTVQDFALTTANLVNGQIVLTGTDTFDSNGACSISVESGSSTGATYDSATDTATYIDELASGDTKTVYVSCPIALTQIDGGIAAISLTAQVSAGGTSGTQGAVIANQTSGVDTAGVDIVFADIAGTDDIAKDGKASSRDAFKVVSAKLKVTKTVVPVCDPFNGNALNGAKNIPGSYVRYTISIENTGAASAILNNVSDTLVSTLALDPDLILINQTLAASVSNSTSTAAACNSVASTFGTATNALGNVNIVQTIRSINAFRTSSTSDSDGVGLVGSLLTVNLATVLPLQTGYTAGELKAGETVSVTFQAKIN